MAGYRVNDVIDALVEAFTVGIADITVPVYDGMPVSDEPLREFVVVGDDAGGGDMAESTAEQVYVGVSGSPRNESGSIACAVIVQQGGTDTRACRVRAFELLASMTAAVVADIDLGGIVMESRIDGVSYRPLLNEQGVAARLVFTVGYMAAVA